MTTFFQRSALACALIVLGCVVLPAASRAATLNLSDFTTVTPSTDGFFGWSIATGDINNDGYMDVVVGAPYDDTAGTDAGAVYLFYGDSSGMPTLDFGDYDAKFTGESEGDRAGYAVAIDEVIDIDEDNGKDIIIGAPNDDDEASNAGAVYV